MFIMSMIIGMFFYSNSRRNDVNEEMYNHRNVIRKKSFSYGLKTRSEDSCDNDGNSIDQMPDPNRRENID